LLALFPLVASSLGLDFYVSFVRRAMIFALAAASLNFILGFGGMAALGHAGFLGVGAYALVALSDAGFESAWILWPAAMVVAGLVAALITSWRATLVVLLLAAALACQEGGEHYKAMKIQPVEFIHANGIGYFEGNVIKYVSRWRSKGGIGDLRKARHFLDLLIELEEKKAPVPYQVTTAKVADGKITTAPSGLPGQEFR
jgi:hypothetical protein